MIDAVIAGILVAMASLSARFVVWLPQDRLRAWLPWLQATAAGLLLGDALLGMLPEALTHGVPPDRIGELLVLGVLCLFGIECLIRAAKTQPGRAAFAQVDIAGDALHHLVDGVAIGASFALDPRAGSIIAVAIIAHEVPREMGHAGVLVAGGYPARRAFALSLATALAVPLGALAFSAIKQPRFIGAALAVACGMIVYLACADLIPNIWQGTGVTDKRRSLAAVIGVTSGIAFMWITAAVEHLH